MGGRGDEKKQKPPDISPFQRRVLEALYECLKGGRPVISLAEIASRLEAPAADVLKAARYLERVGFVQERPRSDLRRRTL